MTGEAHQIAAFSRIGKTFRKGLRRKRTVVFSEVNVALVPGEVFALLGPNGAGKTTLMKILLGLIKPTQGTGHVLGRPFGSREALGRIGYQPEQPYLYPALTVRETLRFMAGLSRLTGRLASERTDAVVELTGLGTHLHQRVGKLSRGWLQRVTLASALLPDPDLLLLDEPLGGLDPGARLETKRLIERLRDAGKTIWLNSHILPDVEALADRVALLGYGRILAQGTMETLRSGRETGLVITFTSDHEPQPAGPWIVPVMSRRRRQWLLDGDEASQLQASLEALFRQGASIVSVEPGRESLETVFARILDGGPDAGERFEGQEVA